MAGETIRDVVIRCSIKMTDGNVFGAIAAQMKQVVMSLEQQLQITKSKLKLEQSLESTQKEKLTITRENGKLEITRERSLSNSLKIEEQRLQVNKQLSKLQQASATSAAAVAVGGVAPGQVSATIKESTPAKTKEDSDKDKDKGKEFLDKIKDAVEMVKSIPETLQSIATGDWAEQFAVIGLGIVEGMEGVVVAISKVGRDLLIAGATYVADMIRKLPGGKWLASKLDSGAESMASWKGLKPTLGASMRERLEKSGVDTGLTIEEKARAAVTEKLQKQQKLEQERIDMIRKLIPAESELLKIAREKLDAAKQEFGMLTRREQEAQLSIAKQTFDEKGNVRAGGIESLEKDQLDMVRGSTAFKRAFTTSANRGAEGTLGKEFLQRTGVQGAFDDAKSAQDKANREAVVRINDLNFGAKFDINLDPNEIAKKFEEQGKAVAQQLELRLARAIREQLARQQRVAAGAVAGE